MKEAKSIDDYRELVVSASSHYNRKDYQKALDQFLELEKKNPKNYKIHETLAYIYLKLNDIPSAEKSFRIVIQLRKERDPSFIPPPTFEELIGRIDSLEKTEAEYIRLLDGKGDSGAIYSHVPIHLSLHHMSRGNYKKAHEVLVNFKERILLRRNP